MISKSQPKPTQLQSLFNVFQDNKHYETLNVLPLPLTTATVLSCNSTDTSNPLPRTQALLGGGHNARKILGKRKGKWEGQDSLRLGLPPKILRVPGN